MPDLVVDQLYKEYPTPTDPLKILTDVSFDLSRGQNLGILGPSGSGKSTLLQIIGTLDTPTSGRIELEGRDPFVLKEMQLAEFRRDKIGFVFQDHFLLPQLSAVENVLAPCVAKGAVTAAEIQRANELLEGVGLANRASHRPAELSGGERQRVAIARSLIHRPLLLLADEPTGNLDPATADAVTELLLELQSGADQMMMIVVTHSQQLASRLHACLEIQAGQLVRAQN